MVEISSMYHCFVLNISVVTVWFFINDDMQNQKLSACFHCSSY